MADFSHVTETTVRHKYVLSSPTNMAEVGKAWSVAEQQWKAAHPGRDVYDDTFWLGHDDEHVFIYWEETT